MRRATGHALALLLLPGTVAVLVPLPIARLASTELRLPESWPGWSAWWTGLLVLGEDLLLRSPAHLGWAGLLFPVNAAYIPLVEEPSLRARFGEACEECARNVPRLIPRIRPWTRGSDEADPGGLPP